MAVALFINGVIEGTKVVVLHVETSRGAVYASSIRPLYYKDVGYEQAILEKRARAGKPYKDDPGPSHQLPGARSQTIPYSLMGHLIAVCHQYALPDGSLGASKKPDPKMIEYQGYRLFCHSQPCTCEKCRSAPEIWRTVLEELRLLFSPALTIRSLALA